MAQPGTEEAELKEIDITGKPMIAGELSMAASAGEPVAGEVMAEKFTPIGEPVVEGHETLDTLITNGDSASVTEIPGIETPDDMIEADTPGHQSEDGVLIDKCVSYPFRARGFQGLCLRAILTFQYI